MKRMMTNLVLVVSVVAAPSTIVAGEIDAKDIRVEACGVRVTGEGYGGSQELRPFNYFQGTTIAILITVPDPKLIEADMNASTVSALVDNKGTDLLTKGEFAMPGFSGMAMVSEDRKAIMLEIQGGGIPARGAKTLKTAGKFVLRAASDQKAYQAKNVVFKEGAKVMAGPANFTIKEVGKPEWGDKPLMVTLETTQSTEEIAGIRFVDATGTEIPSSTLSTMRVGLVGMQQETRSLTLDRKVDSATIEVSYWTDLQKLSVPFDVTIGVGL